MLVFVKSSSMYAGEFAGYRFTKPEGPEQYESMLFIDTSRGVYVR